MRERNKVKRTIQLARQSKRALFGSLARRSGVCYNVVFTVGLPPTTLQRVRKYSG